MPKRKKKTGGKITPIDKQCGFTLPYNRGLCPAGKWTKGPEDGPGYCFQHSMQVLGIKQTPKQKVGIDAETGPKTIDEVIDFLADVVQRTGKQQMDPKETTALSGAFDKLIKAIAIKMKLDPEHVAQRSFSRETAIKIAQGMTLDDAKRIASERSMSVVRERMKALESVTDVEVQEDADD